MAKYVAIPAKRVATRKSFEDFGYDDWGNGDRIPTVDDADEAQFVGLYDQAGNPLYKVRDKAGF